MYVQQKDVFEQRSGADDDEHQWKTLHFRIGSIRQETFHGRQLIVIGRCRQCRFTVQIQCIDIDT